MTLAELLLLAVVVFCAGALAADYWRRATAAADETARRLRHVRLVRPPADWDKEGWA